MAATLAVANEVAAGLSQLTKLATETTNNYMDSMYKWSKDLDDFNNLQHKLKSTTENWTAALRQVGVSDKESITKPLFDAVRCLEAEKKKIDQIQNNCCWSFMYRYLARPFPALLKDSMQKVVDAFDNIFQASRERNGILRTLDSWAATCPDPQPIFVDRRIVKLAKTEAEVMRHLHDPHGSQVVTLYGGPGTGKSSLASSLAQYYQGNKSAFMDGARYLSCGQSATFDSICKELFTSLGFDESNAESTPDVELDHQDFKHKGTPQAEDPLKKLGRRLKERHLLIVLDDVSNSQLVRKLIVPQAQHVKYLITSHSRDICDGATEVKMESPSSEEAMKILGNHVPTLPGGNIPEDYQDIAYAIIEKADSIPNILAEIGKQIDDYENMATWNDVYERFNVLLSNDQSHRSNKPYASMLMVVDDLGARFKDAQKLLYLMALCNIRYIPENLLQLFFNHVDLKDIDSKDFDSKYLLFKTHLKTLKDRDLILTDGEQSWNLKNTYQNFILERKKEDVNDLVWSLMKDGDNEDDEENLLVKSLCVLYFVSGQNTFTPQVAEVMKNMATKFNISLEDEEKLSKIRDVIDLLLYLLLPSRKGEEFEIRHHRLVSKVIQQFISKQVLDDENFSWLLEDKDLFEKNCDILVNMNLNASNDQPILTKDTRLTFKELTFYLTGSNSKNIVTTLQTLSALSHRTNCDIIIDNSPILESLLEILNCGTDVEKQLACKCLSALAKSPTARRKIASYNGLSKILVDKFTIKVDNVKERIDAIEVLGHIGHDEETSTELLDTPNFLTNIAHFLKDMYLKEEDFLLQIDHSGIYSTIKSLSRLLKGNEDNFAKMRNNEDLMFVLKDIFQKYNVIPLDDDANLQFREEIEEVMIATIYILTLLYPTEYNNSKVKLHSRDLHLWRAYAYEYCGLYNEAFDDFHRADHEDDFNDDMYQLNKCFLKAMLKEYDQALVHANRAIIANPRDSICWQERGVLKILKEDSKEDLKEERNYTSAKDDLDKALELQPNDYEVLKHRAYVNFKLGFEEEAHKDARHAIQIIPKRVVDRLESKASRCLGTLPVPEFLGYHLK